MREMRAAVFYEYNQPMVIETIQIDPPQAGEVLVQIAASGVCRSDLHVLKQEWTAPLPIVLGHEASGRVVEVGAGVTRVATGDPVVLSFAPNCGRCDYCASGRGHLCSTMRREPSGLLPGGTSRLHMDDQPINIFARMGSFAEYAVVHESSVVPISPDVPLDLAALIGCSVTTGIGAVLNTARVPAGSTVVVIGCGGVGLNVIQGARLVSARRIIAVDISLEKLELAQRCGATDLIDARDIEVAKHIRDLTDDGVDFAFEALGSSPTIQAAYDVVRPGGTAVVAGMAPYGEMVPINAFLLAYQEKTLKGSYYGSARTSLDMPLLVHLAQTGQIELDSLVARRYPLEEINEAYRDLDQGESGRGLIVFDD
ncbi:MAG TPA: Zn-dependent alcohol dehydrogenase [Thermomicrobiales bacterium]|nr:Zn-dependent alcohol dehydrogenase [Thermomicrobiales bacterium]